MQVRVYRGGGLVEDGRDQLWRSCWEGIGGSLKDTVNDPTVCHLGRVWADRVGIEKQGRDLAVGRAENIGEGLGDWWRRFVLLVILDEGTP